MLTPVGARAAAIPSLSPNASAGSVPARTIARHDDSSRTGGMYELLTLDLGDGRHRPYWETGEGL